MTTAILTATIWIVSIVALVALLAYTVVRVIRGSIRIFVDFSELADTTAQLDNVQATRELDRSLPSVLLPYKEVRRAHHEHSTARAERKADRRAARHARARALTRAEASTLKAPQARSR